MHRETKFQPLYDSRLNVYDPSELKRWAREFGVSQNELMNAVDTAGTSIEAVSSELRRRRGGRSTR